MRIHTHEDGSITLDQHKFVYTIIQKFFPTDAPWGVPKYRETPAPLDYAARKNSRPQTDEERIQIGLKYKKLHFASSV